jgi:TRAP-type mannitol/chloroaromatic compound transport system permease small subunit
MKRALLRIERLLRMLTGLSGILSGLGMVLMILLVFGNMSARYLFGTGAVWLQELELYLLAFTVMTGFAYAMRHDDHVRIDVFSSHLNRIGKLWLDSFTMLVVAIPISLLMLYYAWPYMAVSYVRGEGSPNAGGMPWLFLPKAMILVGFALVLTEALRQALAGGRRLIFHYRRPRRTSKPAREA